MTDRVALTIEPAGDVTVLDMWDGDPGLDGIRHIRVEPRRWWLFGPAPDVGDAGAVVPIGGGLIRATLAGPGWRDLLGVSGFLDTNALRSGDVAATVIDHVSVWIVAGDSSCEVYVAASLAPTLIELWTATIARDLAMTR